MEQPGFVRRWAPAARAGAVCVALVLATGCGLIGGDASGGGGEAGADGGGSEDAGAGGEAPATEAITTRTLTDDPDVSEVHMELARIDDATMIATMTVEAVPDERANLFGNNYWPWLAESDNDYFSGVGWIDSAAGALRLPYLRDDGSCLCFTGDSNEFETEKGGSIAVSALLPAPPAGVDAVTVITDAALPFVAVPVEDGGDPGGLDLPADAPDATARTWPIGGETTSMDASEETVIGRDSTEINLSTDVLFAVDESELTAEAQDVLADTARRIDESGVEEVRIEGHADETGTDEINDPLSEERAESVRAALEDRIQGDVDFTTEGFGSSQPIADGSGEEDLKRNRRVTIVLPEGAGNGGPDVSAEPAASGAPSPSTSPHQGPEAGVSAEPQGEAAEGRTAHLQAEVINDPFDMDLEVTGLHRLGGGISLVDYRITNNGEKGQNPWGALKADGRGIENLMPVSGVDLVDAESGRRYHTSYYFPDEPAETIPGQDDEGPTGCACSATARTSSPEPGESREYYNLVLIPESVPTVSIEAAMFPAMEGIAHG